MTTTHQCIGWCFTLNNPTEDETLNLSAALSDETSVRYAVMQLETGENGTPHYQGYVEFTKKQRFAAVKKKIGLERLHVEQRKGTRDQAREYCMKEESRTESPLEFGVYRLEGKSCELSALVSSLTSGSSLKDAAIDYPSTYIRNYRGIKDWIGITQSISEMKENLRGIWFYGVPGSGKTRYVHEHYDDLYIKSQNKWWDMYAGQRFVLLDDLDHNGSCLSHYLKIWSDHYPQSGEIKGGTVKLNHDKFIVTSNYTPADLWEKDPDLQRAICRRFELWEYDKKTTSYAPSTHDWFINDK